MAVIDLGNKTTSGSSASFTYSTTEINNAINAAGIPSNCKVSSVIIEFRGAKSVSLATGKANITLSVGSYSTTKSGVIANDGTNNDFGSGDSTCYTDNIVNYIGTSNGRFNHNINLSMSKGANSTYWRSSVKLHIEYQTPYTVSVSAGAGGDISSTGGSYYAGTTFSVSATASTGYTFAGWANTSGTITTTANPYSFTVNGNTTFSAVFTPITYYVAYSANGGTGTMATDSVKYGADYYVKNNTFTGASVVAVLDDTRMSAIKPFIGWLSDDGTAYSQGQKVNSLKSTEGASVIMSAQWGAVSFTLPVLEDKPGEKFIGWDNGINTYPGGATITTEDHMSFASIWEIIETTKEVYGGNTQATVYVANDECVAVYVGNTKIYG